MYTNTYTPGWVSTPFYSGSFINVENLLCVPPGNSSSDAYTFTTRATSQFTAPDGKSYHFQMVNPYYESGTPTPGAQINTPFVTSLVIVKHSPAGATTPETWIVYPDPSVLYPANAIGTLLAIVKGTVVNAGHFSMPFVLTITRK